jgi:hypothetical protein
LVRDRPKPRSLLYLTEVLVARTGTFSPLIDRIRPQLQSISSREPGAPDGILVVLIGLVAHRADAWKSRRAHRTVAAVPRICCRPPTFHVLGGSQSCRHYQSLTLVSDTVNTNVAMGSPVATTSSHTVDRCCQSSGVPARRTTSRDVLCLMSTGAGPVARGADAKLSGSLGWLRTVGTATRKPRRRRRGRGMKLHCEDI